MNPDETAPIEDDPTREDWRFAPPLDADDEADLKSEDTLSDESADVDDEVFEADDLDFEAEADERDDFPVMAETLDIDAALAAVSTLDDMLAEQEATEQAIIARELAEQEAREQRELRLKNPELFFPMPALMASQRGRLDSIVPALVLILIGAWLTFTLTTTQSLPDPMWLILAVAGGLGAVSIARWLASGRWSVGMLFIGLFLWVLGGTFVALLAVNALVTGWPLLLTAAGMALIITSMLTRGFDLRLFFPGLVIALAGLAGYVVTGGWLPLEVNNVLAGIWPVILLLAVIILILPGVLRRQRQG